VKSKDLKQERQATLRNEDPTKHRFEDSIEGPIQSDAEAGFGLSARATCPTAFGHYWTVGSPRRSRAAIRHTAKGAHKWQAGTAIGRQAPWSAR